MIVNGMDFGLEAEFHADGDIKIAIWDLDYSFNDIPVTLEDLALFYYREGSDFIPLIPNGRLLCM